MKGLFFKYKSGKWNYYYPNGYLKEQGIYKGIFESRVGNWNLYYENGQKWKEVDYTHGIEIWIEKE